MKKIIFTTLALVAVFGMLFVSCNPEESKKHEYTQEELDEIARQDSLRKIIPADYVLTQDVTIPLTDDYTGTTVSLIAPSDTTKLLDSLGFSTTKELVAALGTCIDQVQADYDVEFFAYNYSTKYEYDGASTTNYFGHWFDGNGDVCFYTGDPYVYCEKQNEEDLLFTIGSMPGKLATGELYHIVEAINYDGYKVAFLFNVTVGDEPVVEYPVTTLQGTLTYDVEEAYDESYAATAFAIDAATIAAAIGVDPASATLYAVDPSRQDSLYIDGFTANNGFWFTAAGDVCTWSHENSTLYAEYNSDNQEFNIGQYPARTTVGQTYTITLAYVNLDNMKQYNVVFNITITEAPLVYPETVNIDTLYITFSAAAQATDWVDNVFELDSAAVHTAIGCAPSAATFYGIDATRQDSLYIKGYTASAGYFFNTSGDVCAYAAENCAFYVEFRPEKVIGIGQYPGGCTAGQTYYAKVAWVNDGKQENLEIAMTITE